MLCQTCMQEAALIKEKAYRSPISGKRRTLKWRGEWRII